jgi:hypothetical protein
MSMKLRWASASLVAVSLVALTLTASPAFAAKPYRLIEKRHTYIVVNRTHGFLALRCRAESYTSSGIGLVQTERIRLDGRGDRQRVRVLGTLESVRCRVMRRG